MIKICNILIGIYSLLKTYDVHMLYNNLIYYFLCHISAHYAFYLPHKILDVCKSSLVKTKCIIEPSLSKEKKVFVLNTILRNVKSIKYYNI